MVFIDGVLDVACVLRHPGGSNMGTQGMPSIGDGRVKLMLGGGICKKKICIITNSKPNPNPKWKIGHHYFLYLKDLLCPLLHARPHLVAEAPQCVKLQDGVDALAGLRVLELRHHHFAAAICSSTLSSSSQAAGWMSPYMSSSVGLLFMDGVLRQDLSEH
ncbi:hypothetical protein F7725_009276 [Dissostichus mawsoni]|uniref:Uncharacterized protein n=1 Tax=Dissostichus mawsoni TaxID=36200 RepID=A0A7J5Z9P9_DISMA|nr:hypothetical protein F7725_009276 [Dissostichus mawsoni]